MDSNEPTRRDLLRSLATLPAAALLLPRSIAAGQTREGATEVHGFGEAQVAPRVTFNKVGGGTKDIKSFGKTSLGAAGDTVGNRITFAFGATKDAKGNVQGQMYVTDHALNLTISSDVAVLKPHPWTTGPVGVEAHGSKHPVRMVSSATSVVVNGEPQPDWKFINSPVFEGDKHLICPELKSPDGKKVYQWVAFLSAGNVTIK